MEDGPFPQPPTIAARYGYAFAAVFPLEAIYIYCGFITYFVLSGNGAALRAVFRAIIMILLVFTFIGMRLAQQSHKLYSDLWRSLIPAAAFVTWSLMPVQSAADAVWGSGIEACRYIVAIIAMLSLYIVAAASGPIKSHPLPSYVDICHMPPNGRLRSSRRQPY